MTLDKKKIVLRQKNESDDKWIEGLFKEYWAEDFVVTRGHIHYAIKIPSLIAELDNQKVGCLTYCIKNNECEVVSLISLKEKVGIGSLLLKAIEVIAKELKCNRVWIITTNDNSKAIEFYENRGYHVCRIYENAIDQSRKLKPSIPLTNSEGVPIKDEIELQKELH